MLTFPVLADSLHVVAVLILLLKICITRNCSGISGKSQVLFTLVYITRYIDVLFVYISHYNTIMKLFFLCCSITTLSLIYIVFRESYDEDRDSFRIEFLIVLALVLAVLIHYELTILETSWTFSVYLESVAILPQLFLLLKVLNAEKIITYYLVARGSYRALYLVNWQYRFYQENYYDHIAMISAIVQTSIYVIYFLGFSKFKLQQSTEIGQKYKGNMIAVINIETPNEKSTLA